MFTGIDADALFKVLAPLLVALIGAIAKRYLEGRPKLITYLVHSNEHPMPPNPQTPQAPPQNVHTHTIVVRNTGKKTAHNVRIDHAFFPLSYVVTPPVNHRVTPGQGQSAEICLPTLVPNEQVSVSYLYFPPLTWRQINGWVKCDEGMAKVIQAIPRIPPPLPARILFWGLAFIGASTIMYWALHALPFVLK